MIKKHKMYFALAGSDDALNHAITLMAENAEECHPGCFEIRHHERAEESYADYYLAIIDRYDRVFAGTKASDCYGGEPSGRGSYYFGKDGRFLLGGGGPIRVLMLEYEALWEPNYHDISIYLESLSSTCECSACIISKEIIYRTKTSLNSSDSYTLTRYEIAADVHKTAEAQYAASELLKLAKAENAAKGQNIYDLDDPSEKAYRAALFEWLVTDDIYANSVKKLLKAEKVVSKDDIDERYGWFDTKKFALEYALGEEPATDQATRSVPSRKDSPDASADFWQDEPLEYQIPSHHTEDGLLIYERRIMHQHPWVMARDGHWGAIDDMLSKMLGAFPWVGTLFNWTVPDCADPDCAESLIPGDTLAIFADPRHLASNGYYEFRICDKNGRYIGNLSGQDIPLNTSGGIGADCALATLLPHVVATVEDVVPRSRRSKGVKMPKLSVRFDLDLTGADTLLESCHELLLKPLEERNAHSMLPKGRD